jgi:hypothetical protein
MRVVAEQRRRCLASIMSAAEVSPWWQRLTLEERRNFRERVIAALGTFYDLCRDVIKVTEDDMIRNEYAVELLEEIHAVVTVDEDEED